jgi:hypothetical protein
MTTEWTTTVWWALTQHPGDIGLALNVIGAILISFFGLPAAADRGGRIYLTVAQVDRAEVRKAARAQRLGRLGAILLVVGFGLQLAANLLPAGFGR